MINSGVAKRSIGVQCDTEGCRAVVWAPSAETVAVEIVDGIVCTLEKCSEGYWLGERLPMVVGDYYWLVLDGKERFPDPASLSQPDGVHGPSQVVNPGEYLWTDVAWQGQPLADMIIYELHVGTFSAAGEFDGMIGRLDYLCELGVTAVELMPVAQFSGSRNWGYDGVFPFAVQQSYGGPAGLQRLVDACHARGLSVILDVVYNHLGPEGNILRHFGPYFTDQYKTPWGEAVNLDDAWCDAVRRFWIENALMWLRDFHIDALRLDAVHAIKDFGAHHFMAELKEQVERLDEQLGRQHYLIAECDLNDVRYLNPRSKGGYQLDAQWCDEFHHALHAFVTGERKGYYADFGALADIVKSFQQAYVYNGVYSSFRKRTFGSSTHGQPGHKFVVCSQNHDQVGNRMVGERLTALIGIPMQKVVATVCLLSPFIPLLFMGEEYAESSPFLYFTSHQDPALCQAVREGRKREFADFAQDGEPPDPQSEDTFLRSRLTDPTQWQAEQKDVFLFYQRLIMLRKQHALLRGASREGLRAEILAEHVLRVVRKGVDLSLEILCNFGTTAYNHRLASTANSMQILLHSADTAMEADVDLSAAVEGQPATLCLPPASVVVLEMEHAKEENVMQDAAFAALSDKKAGHRDE